MVIQRKPTNFPEELLKMRYILNRLRARTSARYCHMVGRTETLSWNNLPVFIQVLVAAFRDHDQVATAERKMQEMIQKTHEFSQYSGEFPVIATNLDWNPSALRDAIRMQLSEEMTDSFTNSDVTEELPAFITVCEKQDYQI
jgi:hypothetical protein